MIIDIRRVPGAAHPLVLCALLAAATAQARTPDGDSDRNALKSSRDVGEFGEQSRPAWGVEITAAPMMFGGQGLVPQHGNVESWGTSLRVEYQPKFLQRFGTLSLGPQFMAMPVSQSSGLTSGFFAVWSVGAEARYQFRYVANQLLVPVVGYEVEAMRYAFTTGAQGTATLSGPSAGLELLLNKLDREKSEDFYEETGISRTYLTADARVLTGNDATISVSGLSCFFGLRFEL